MSKILDFQSGREARIDGKPRDGRRNADWLPDDEQRLFDSIVHGLRSQGWPRSDAEAEAIDRVVKRRDAKGSPQ